MHEVLELLPICINLEPAFNRWTEDAFLNKSRSQKDRSSNPSSGSESSKPEPAGPSSSSKANSSPPTKKPKLFKQKLTIKGKIGSAVETSHFADTSNSSITERPSAEHVRKPQLAGPVSPAWDIEVDQHAPSSSKAASSSSLGKKGTVVIDTRAIGWNRNAEEGLEATLDGLSSAQEGKVRLRATAVQNLPSVVAEVGDGAASCLSLAPSQSASQVIRSSSSRCSSVPRPSRVLQHSKYFPPPWRERSKSLVNRTRFSTVADQPPPSPSPVIDGHDQEISQDNSRSTGSELSYYDDLHGQLSPQHLDRSPSIYSDYDYYPPNDEMNPEACGHDGYDCQPMFGQVDDPYEDMNLVYDDAADASSGFAGNSPTDHHDISTSTYPCACNEDTPDITYPVGDLEYFMNTNGNSPILYEGGTGTPGQAIMEEWQEADWNNLTAVPTGVLEDHTIDRRTTWSAMGSIDVENETEDGIMFTAGTNSQLFAEGRALLHDSIRDSEWRIAGGMRDQFPTVAKVEEDVAKQLQGHWRPQRL